jgi:hypothetical protein
LTVSPFCANAAPDTASNVDAIDMLTTFFAIAITLSNFD